MDFCEVWYQCQRVTRACKLLPSHFRSNLGIHGLVEEDEVQHLLKDVLVVPRGAAVFPRPQSAHGDHAVPDLLQLGVNSIEFQQTIQRDFQHSD